MNNKKENQNNNSQIFEINSRITNTGNNSPDPQEILNQIKTQEEEK